jgi:hypothetical protein
MKSMKLVSSTVAAGLVLLMGAGPVLASSGASERVPNEGGQVTRHAGNFIASDDQQVCYEIDQLEGVNFPTDTDLRGFKIDPPMDYGDDYISMTILPDGKYLNWELTAAEMHAIIIKGGPDFHLYNYAGTGFEWDNNLHSPLHPRNGQLPNISHYNVCYTPFPPAGDQGCTPGYWRNHADRWVGVAPSDDFNATFGVVDLFDLDITLGHAIWLGGGGNNAFARHATAALLNAYGGVPNADDTTVAYPYTVAEVIQMVQDAVANGTIEATKDLFEEANELGCPLSGTRANPIPQP